MKGITACYVRVSTQEQAETGYSLQEQSERLQAYCKAMDYDNVVVFEDSGKSGSNTNRPALKRLLKQVKNGEVERVIITKLDRMSRNTKDMLEIIELLKNNSCDFVSITESIDTGTPAGVMMFTMLSAYTQYERDMIRERTQRGKEQKIKQGKTNISGAVPFGYKKARATKGSSYVIKKEDAEIIVRIYNDRNDGYSFGKLEKKYGMPRCKLWNILNREEMYSGMFYGNYHSELDILKGLKKDDPEIISAKVEKRVEERRGEREERQEADQKSFFAKVAGIAREVVAENRQKEKQRRDKKKALLEKYGLHY